MARSATAVQTAPTTQAYGELQTAYDHFNRELFGGTLPPCLITFQRQRGAYGYFSGNRFEAKHGTPVRGGSVHAQTDEIAMNPNHIGARDDKATLSTLAHEMCHLWQHHFGKPGRRGYHNAEWGTKMKAIGLLPTSTGMAGGKETGEKVTHMIQPGGPFEKSCARLLATGLKISWHDPHADSDAKKKKSNTRAKFTCPGCGLNAWAKPGAPLGCTDCDEPMQEEVPEDSEE